MSSPPPPFHLMMPSSPTHRLPLFYDSPHSGRYYPKDFKPSCPLTDLRKGEDAYVDLLISPSSPLTDTLNLQLPDTQLSTTPSSSSTTAPSPDNCHVALLSPTPTAAGDSGALSYLLANYPRCYVDVNRAPNDIDPNMLLMNGQGFPFPLHPTTKSKKGLGLLRRLVNPGIEIYERKLTPEEVLARLTSIYWPYHSVLKLSLETLCDQHGFCWHINWHSMKSKGNAMTPDGATDRPHFVVSDLDGCSATPEFTNLVVSFLKCKGYTVSVNSPYKGGHIVKTYGASSSGSEGKPKAKRGIHTLQIEINRSLYLDEEHCILHAGFWQLRQAIQDLTIEIRMKIESLLQSSDEEEDEDLL